MKKIFTRIVAFILVLASVMPMLIGCSFNDGKDYIDGDISEEEAGKLTPESPLYDESLEIAGVIISSVYGTGENRDAAIEHSFVQLYNTNDRSVSLENAALFYRNKDNKDYVKLEFNAGTEIGAKEFFLIRFASAKEKSNEEYDESFAVMKIDNFDYEFDLTLDNKEIRLALAPKEQNPKRKCPPNQIDGRSSYYVASETASELLCAVDNMTKSKVAVRTALEDYSGFHKVNLTEATTSQLRQVCPESSKGENTVLRSFVDEVVFSADAGIYREGFALTLSSKDGYTVYYTLDGSDPRECGIPYSAPLELKDTSALPTGPTTAGIANATGGLFAPFASSMPGGYVVKAYATDGENSTDVFTNTYFISEVFHSYGVTLMSLSMDKRYFYGEEGFYTHYYAAGEEKNLRSLGIMEVFSEDGERHGCSYVEVAISGHASSTLSMKSMRLYYKSANNTAVGTDGDLNYDLFEGLARDERGNAITDFSRLTLRNSGNDYMRSFIRDAYMQRVSSGLDVSTMAYAPVILFINGELWGVYNARERYSPEYVESHYGVDKDNVAIIENDYEKLLHEGDRFADFLPADATDEDAKDFMSLCDKIILSVNPTDEALAEIEKRMDFDSFIDMFIARLYFNSRDFPENNIKVFRYKIDNSYSKWYFTLLDMDMGMSHFTDDKHSTAEDRDYFNWLSQQSTMGLVIMTLMRNESFKERFLRRFAKALNDVYVEERLEAELDKMIAEREPLIELQAKRWGYKDSTFRSQTELMRKYIKNRRPYLISALCTHFGITEEEFQAYADAEQDI